MTVSVILTGELYCRLIGFCTRVRKEYSVRKGALDESLCEFNLSITSNVSLYFSFSFFYILVLGLIAQLKVARVLIGN